MTMNFKTILFVVLALNLPALAQETAEKPEEASFAKAFEDFLARYQVSLRQSTIDKNAIEKPASLQYVDARDGGKNSYAIDVGLTASLIPNTSDHAAHWYAGPTVEYHKQTQTSKEQENFQAGLTVINIAGDVAASGWAHFTQASAKYKHDKKTIGTGFLSKLDYTPLCPRLLLGQAKGPDWLHFTWQPTVGVQVENGNNILKSTRSGTDFRAKTVLEVGIYPFAKALRHHLEVASGFTYWRTMTDSGEFEFVRNDRTLFKAGVTYYLDEKRRVGIGLDYTNGQDVEQGLLRQENLIASLKARF